MKKFVLMMAMILVSSAACADLGGMLKAVQSNPVVAQQGSINNLIGMINNISSTFSKMPATSGKLDFLKQAMPLLNKANAAKPGDVTQISGLLDQVKGLLGQKWSNTPLTAAQVPQATSQSQQFSGLLANLLKGQSAGLKNLMPAGN